MRFMALLFCLLVVGPLSAKDMAVGTVDLQKLFKEFPGTKTAEKKFTTMAEAKRKDLMDSAQEIQDLKKELSASNSLLSEKTKARKQKEYNDKVQGLEQLQAQIQNDLKVKEAEMSLQILDQIRALAAEEAKARGIDLLLDSEKTIYAKDSVDLTADLLKKFEKMTPAAEIKEKVDPAKKKK